MSALHRRTEEKRCDRAGGVGVSRRARRSRRRRCFFPRWMTQEAAAWRRASRLPVRTSALPCDPCGRMPDRLKYFVTIPRPAGCFGCSHAFRLPSLATHATCRVRCLLVARPAGGATGSAGGVASGLRIDHTVRLCELCVGALRACDEKEAGKSVMYAGQRQGNDFDGGRSFVGAVAMPALNWPSEFTPRVTRVRKRRLCAPRTTNRGRASRRGTR